MTKPNITVVDSGRAVNFRFKKSNLTACLNGHTIKLAGRPGSFSFNPKENSFAAVVQRGFRFKNLTLDSDRLCNLFPNGNFPESLAPEFGYIPNGAKVSTGRIQCLDKNTITSTKVTLDADTVICGAEFPKGTIFSYEDDEHYHFTSKRMLTLKSRLADGTSTTISVMPGVDYRNENPAANSCNWNATPSQRELPSP